jgi:hypothetical protein
MAGILCRADALTRLKAPPASVKPEDVKREDVKREEIAELSS